MEGLFEAVGVELSPSIQREIAAYFFATVMPLLITMKSDRQSINILEAKCQRLGLDEGRGKLAYRKHKRLSSVLLFVAGSLIGATAIIWFVDQNALYPVAAVAGLLMVAAGIVGRAVTFYAADKALDRIRHEGVSTEARSAP